MRIKTLFPEEPVFLPSPNRTLGRWRGRGKNKRKERVGLVIIHATGPGPFHAQVDWLRRSNRSGRSSAHYVVGRNGSIVQLVRESDKAWHAGVSIWGGRQNVNARSIGIELVNRNDGKEDYPIYQIKSALWLSLRCCKRFGLRPEQVIGHYHVAPGRKTDPAGFPFKEFRESLGKWLQAC